MSQYPKSRPRRLRRTPTFRQMIKETTLTNYDFIFPIFVVHGENIKEEIAPLPGQFHWSIDKLNEIISRVESAKIPAIMLFGIPKVKDAQASENYDDNGIVQQAVKKIRQLAPNLIIMTDVCLCSFTDHGHCGVLENDIILNDETLEILKKTAISHAKSGADVVAPSGMMDGMIQAMRSALDNNGFINVSIMSYAIKYASAFYGPFRSACNSSLKGDRKTYQMDFHNKKEALREAALDEQEGADFLIIKPALAYLDVVKEVSEQSLLPIVAYNVSGEYAMVKGASEKGWIDEKAIVLESLIAMKRAGANLILTYHALDAAKWVNESD